MAAQVDDVCLSSSRARDQDNSPEGIENWISDSSSQVTGNSGECRELVKKKKKKRSKKKKPTDNVADFDQDSLNESTISPKEAELKYISAIESLRSNDEFSLWVQLGNCRLGDRKAKKVAEALRSNKRVISIDLSCNLISDEGAVQLAHVLSSGAAPDLLQVDLRGNNITSRGITVLEELKTVRKLTRIEVVDAQPETPKTAQEKEWDTVEAMPKGTPSVVPARLPANGVLSSEEQQVIFRSAMKAIHESHQELNPPRIWEAFSRLMLIIARELREEPQKAFSAAKTSSLPPGLRLVCENLAKLLSVLDLPPAPSGALRGAGLHRIAALDLILHLLVPCNKCIEKEIALTNVMSGKLLELMFLFPENSRLHSTVSRIIEVVLCRPATPLAAALLGGRSGLVCRLAEEGTAAMGVPIARRKGCVGHVIRLSQKLASMAVDHRAIQKRLLASKAWQQYAADGGALSAFVREQQGFLGGAKPDCVAELFVEAAEDRVLSMAEELAALHAEYLKRVHRASRA